MSSGVSNAVRYMPGFWRFKKEIREKFCALSLDSRS
jgi:hypothetical protein